jgi:hypothetical protein
MKKINTVFINQMVKDELLKDKYVKTAFYVVGGVIAIALCGNLFRVLNFTIHHYKNLNSTLKR